jgi:Na+-transporting NADH:ubiquinone oxidoreductase subunit C
MSINKEGTIYTIVFTFVVAFAFVLLLAMTNGLTAERIDLNQEIRRKQSVLNALGVSYESQQDVLETYDQDVTLQEIDGVQLYRAQVDGRTVYAKQFSSNGLWGTITGVIAVNEDVSRIQGLEIIAHNETPGLGGRIDEDWFKDQFRNERITDGTIRVTSGEGLGDPDPDNGEVDAIAGATRTSEYMEIIANEEIALLQEVLGAN